MNPPVEKFEVELRVLRGLCSASTRLAEVRLYVGSLRDYVWSGVDHGVVFGAIVACVERGSVVTRETLGGLATRAGFPEVAWEQYFCDVVSVDLDLAGGVEELRKVRRD